MRLRRAHMPAGLEPNGSSGASPSLHFFCSRERRPSHEAITRAEAKRIALTIRRHLRHILARACFDSTRTQASGRSDAWVDERPVAGVDERPVKESPAVHGSVALHKFACCAAKVPR